MVGLILAPLSVFFVNLRKSFLKLSFEVQMDSEISLEWPAISVRQPWAELLISGRKSIEIRPWMPEYRGRMWLHVGLKSNPELEVGFGFKDLYRGGFVGSIELIAVVPITEERWMQWRDKHLDPGGYHSGLVAWMMGTPRRFQMPVPGKGQLYLFDPPMDVAEQLKRSEEAIKLGDQ
jgi:ASCH domain